MGSVTPSYKAELDFNLHNGHAPSGSSENFSARTQELPYPNTNCAFLIPKVTPVRSGHTFLYWKNLAGTKYYPSTNSSSNYIVIPTGSTTELPNVDVLKAIWKNDTTYSAILHFNSNGGSGSPSAITKTSTVANEQKTFSKPNKEPTRSGYTFVGWGTSKSSTTAVSWPVTRAVGNSSDPEKDYYLYAIWSAHTYNIYYKIGTQTEYTDTKSYGIPITLRGATFTRPGYSQTGWSKNQSGSPKDYALGATYSTNASLTIYPYWSKKTYYIKFLRGSYGNGTEQELTKGYGETIDLLGAIFTRTGYLQTGWSEQPSGSPKNYNLGASYSDNYSKNLYPYWTPNQYEVRYHSGFGANEQVITQNVTYDQAWTTRDSFPRPGYTQQGWATTPGGPKVYSLNKAQGPWNKTHDLDLYAVWDAVSIVHIKKGGVEKIGLAYVIQNGTPKLGIVYVKGADGQIHQNA